MNRVGLDNSVYLCYNYLMYLTESNLKDYIEQIYPDTEWIHDKRFPEQRFRLDYVNHDKKIVIEFDGYQHYTKALAIIRDTRKDRILTSLGYTVIRIPYFIQLDKKTIKVLFGIDCNIQQQYPHGFISNEPTLVLPCDFCELGIENFKKDLDRFTCIKEDIIKSLVAKYNKLGDWNIVLPPSLYRELIA